VKEYLAVQELQLLGESAMSDAVHKFVDKDNPQSISMYVVCIFLNYFYFSALMLGEGMSTMQ